MDLTKLFEHIGRYNIKKTHFKMFTGMSTREVNLLYDRGELSLENAVRVCKSFHLQPNQISDELQMSLAELTELSRADKTARWNLRLQHDLE